MGRGWRSYIRYDEQRRRPKVNGAVRGRVAGYGRPYLGPIGLMLLTILPAARARQRQVLDALVRSGTLTSTEAASQYQELTDLRS